MTAPTFTPTMVGGHPDETQALMEAWSLECGICGFAIRGCGWVTHHGERCHPSCYEKTNEQPDIVTGHGKYAPGGSCGCLAEHRRGLSAIDSLIAIGREDFGGAS